MTMSKLDKVYNLLNTGKNYTAEQIRRKTGVQSPSAAIRDLRNEGFQIYANVKGSKGSKYTAYRMAS